jgi:hypothetical protein
VLRVEVDRVGEELERVEQLEPLDRLPGPVRVLELDVGVDPGGVAPALGQVGEADVEQVLLAPQLRARAQLDVVAPAGPRDLERALALGELDREQADARARHLRREALVEPPAGPVADGVGDAGHDVEQVGAHGRGTRGWSAGAL